MAPGADCEARNSCFAGTGGTCKLSKSEISYVFNRIRSHKIAVNTTVAHLGMKRNVFFGKCREFKVSAGATCIVMSPMLYVPGKNQFASH